MVVDRNYPSAIIFEDDVRLVHNFKQQLEVQYSPSLVITSHHNHHIYIASDQLALYLCWCFCCCIFIVCTPIYFCVCACVFVRLCACVLGKSPTHSTRESHIRCGVVRRDWTSTSRGKGPFRHKVVLLLPIPTLLPTPLRSFHCPFHHPSYTSYYITTIYFHCDWRHPLFN